MVAAVLIAAAVATVEREWIPLVETDTELGWVGVKYDLQRVGTIDAIDLHRSDDRGRTWHYVGSLSVGASGFEARFPPGETWVGMRTRYSDGSDSWSMLRVWYRQVKPVLDVDVGAVGLHIFRDTGPYDPAVNALPGPRPTRTVFGPRGHGSGAPQYHAGSGFAGGCGVVSTTRSGPTPAIR